PCSQSGAKHSPLMVVWWRQSTHQQVTGTAPSRALPKTERIRESRIAKRERGIWQRRYWEHLIRDDLDLQAHVNYIHFNPVKHGYCIKPVDWPYSSIHLYIRRGWIKSDWAVDINLDVE
ncbi:REP-associated tyrosine transposase, partial [Aeromonas encheleia]